MASILSNFPSQCREALRLAEGTELPDVKPSSIYIAGMGGSGIAGRLLRSYLQDELDIPLMIVRDYKLPESANKSSLVFAVSASGNTEETLAVYEEAKARAATIIGLTSGGRLGKVCSEDGRGCMKFPPGLPPRCTLGYQFFLLLRSLELMGILAERKDDIDEAIMIAETVQDGEARLLAERVHDKIPIIYSSQWLEPVAYRWTTQLNENAKMLAFHNAIPEQNHNQINALPDADKNLFYGIFIRDIEDNKRRFEFTKSVAAFMSSETYTIGSSRLARMISAICMGDWCSYYAALMRNVDPISVDVIEKLKKHLES